MHWSEQLSAWHFHLLSVNCDRNSPCASVQEHIYKYKVILVLDWNCSIKAISPSGLEEADSGSRCPNNTCVAGFPDRVKPCWGTASLVATGSDVQHLFLSPEVSGCGLDVLTHSVNWELSPTFWWTHVLSLHWSIVQRNHCKDDFHLTLVTELCSIPHTLGFPRVTRREGDFAMFNNTIPF